MQPTQPIKNEDEQSELELMSRQANFVKEMLDTKGWKEVLKPAIDQQVEKLLGLFKNARKYEEFVMIQQSINAIENIMNVCNIVVAQGEDAKRRIAEQNQRDLNEQRE